MLQTNLRRFLERDVVRQDECPNASESVILVN